MSDHKGNPALAAVTYWGGLFGAATAGGACGAALVFPFEKVLIRSRYLPKYAECTDHRENPYRSMYRSYWKGFRSLRSIEGRGSSSALFVGLPVRLTSILSTTVPLVLIDEITRVLLLRARGGTSLTLQDEAIAGAIAGCGTVMMQHPFDVIRTQIQRQSIETKGFRHHSLGFMADYVREVGARELYRGVAPRMAMNTSAHAATFALLAAMLATPETEPLRNSGVDIPAAAFSARLLTSYTHRKVGNWYHRLKYPGLPEAKGSMRALCLRWSVLQATEFTIAVTMFEWARSCLSAHDAGAREPWAL